MFVYYTKQKFSQNPQLVGTFVPIPEGIRTLDPQNIDRTSDC